MFDVWCLNFSAGNEPSSASRRFCSISLSLRVGDMRSVLFVCIWFEICYVVERFGVWNSGLEVWDLGFRVWGLGFRVWGLGFRVCDSGVLKRTMASLTCCCVVSKCGSCTCAPNVSTATKLFSRSASRSNKIVL